jgi:21S rRNA (GM2251-2'-O)-methyltransferase
MAASSLSAASLCARAWTRGPQWQSRTFIRNVSRTSAINRGINASQRSTALREGGRSSAPSGYSRSSRDAPSGRSNDKYGAASSFQRNADAFSDSRDAPKFSSRSGGRSSDKRETRRDQRRSNRKDGGNEDKRSEYNDAFSQQDMSGSKPSSFSGRGRDRTRGFDGGARPSRDNDRGSLQSFEKRPQRDGDRTSTGSSEQSAWSGKDDRKPTGPAYEKKSRFENEGVRAYGDNTGFFSKGSRSRRPGDRPLGGSGDRSGRPARDSPKSFDRSARPDRNSSTSFDNNDRPTRDGDRRSAESFDRSARPSRNGDRSSSKPFDRNARPTRDGDRQPAGFLDRSARPSRDGDRKAFDKSAERPVRSERIEHDDVPVAIPYSSAASQWLYGVNTVIAALRGNKRKIYQLIVKKGERSSDADQILRLANSAGITIQTHDDTRLLDKLSEGRPHNGAVLETSTLPALPTVRLGKPASQLNTVPLELQKQNAEEIAVNGKSTTLQYDGKSWRQPIVLFLDGITDPGNVGGILRTAHFYGVDAVAVATNTCCNLNSPVLAKASAGACESIPILAVSKPADFISKSSSSGWKICAAVAPDVRSQKMRKQLTAASIAAKSPLASSPCILMMGSEGEGLRENLLSKADLEVTIARGSSAKHVVDVGVDSMNVGVATGVLVDAFMRDPSPKTPGLPGQNRVF